MQVGKRMMEFDFNPRSPHGERREAAAALRRGAEFQSTLPARGATLVFVALCGTLSFQSTLPARGATEHGSQISLHISHFNPRSPHGERRHTARLNMLLSIISIHAPRTGSDGTAYITNGRAFSISIHAPRTGSDWADRGDNRRLWDFNPRSPHGERRDSSYLRMVACYFNPRSPHGERLLRRRRVSHRELFQSTLPARGATLTVIVASVSMVFQSTLPARGATALPGRVSPTSAHFNPRSPHGERLSLSQVADKSRSSFQSTLPARGATSAVAAGIFTQEISIHAPRTGSDLGARRHGRRPHNFNPRSPHGERQIRDVNANTFQPFQSTLPARGAT